MKRRILKARSGAADAGDETIDDGGDVPPPSDTTGPAPSEPESWLDWEQADQERVARWLQSKVRPEIEVVEGPATAPILEDHDVVHLDDTAPGRHAGSRYEAEAWRLDQQRRRLAAEAEADRAQAERARRQQLDAWARLEVEMSELDQKRHRLADAVEAERAEVERVRQEQQDARARLESAVAELDLQRQRLTAVEAERSEAERARQEHAEARAALQADVATIDEQRRQLMAAVEAERSETERARRAHADARARLEAEMSELDHQRRRLLEAVEAERAEAERVRVEQLEAKARLEAEVAGLDHQRQLLLASRAAERAEAERADAERIDAARAQADAIRAEAVADAALARAERAEAPPGTGAEGPDAGEIAPPSGPPTGPPDAGEAGDVAAAREQGRTRRRRLVAVGGDATETDAPDAGPALTTVAQHEREQAEAKARLAAAVAELARHVATAHAVERTEAERIRRRQLEAAARQEEEAVAAAEARRRAAEAREVARAGSGQARQWAKVAAIALAVLSPLALDVRSAVVTRSRLESIAEDAVQTAATHVAGQGSHDAARRVAQAAADTEGVVLESFLVDGRDVYLTLTDDAGSLLLGKLPPTRSWFDVRVRTTANAVGVPPPPYRVP